jgi:hypothetical protein
VPGDEFMCTNPSALSAGVPCCRGPANPIQRHAAVEITNDLGLSEQSLRVWIKQADLDAGHRDDGVDDQRAGGAAAAAS